MTRSVHRRHRLLSATTVAVTACGLLAAVTLAATPATAAPLAGAGIGERPGYTLLAAPLSDRVAVQVNPGTGNLELRSTDLSVRGTGLNYSLVRYWNSLATGAGAFGTNGSMNNGADVRLTTGAGGTVTYTAPSGFAVTYSPSSGNSYTSPATYQAADLVKTSSGWTLTFHANSEQLSFDSAGKLTRDADRNGNANTYAYNPDGSLRQVTDTQGRLVNFDYENGRIHSMTDPAGRHTLYAYDASGNLTKVTDPTGAVWQFSYFEGNSNLNQIVDPRGNAETFSYDAAHRVTKATYAAYTSSAAATTYSYAGTTTTITDPLGHATTYKIDGNSSVTAVTDPLGNARGTTFDPNGNITSSTSPSAAVTNYTYLSNGRLASAQMPTETNADGSTSPGAMTSVAYGTSGQPYLPSQVTDPQGGQTRFGYDTAGNQTSVSTFNADGSSTSTTNTATRTYQGNPNVSCGAKAGELCTSATPLGGTTSYSYDSAGNVTAIAPPAPLGRQTFSYDNLSRVTGSTDGKGIRTASTYDDNDRLISTTTAGATVSYAYDPSGNLTSRTDATGSTTYNYDAVGHLTHKAAPGSWGRSYAYDLAGNLTASSDSGGPAGTTTYNYDAANEPTKITDSASAVTTLTWANARRTATAYPNGVTQTVTYDNAGRPVRTVAARGTTTLVDQTGSYQTTAKKDQQLLQTVRDAVAGTSTTYSYDGQNRLTRALTSGNTLGDYRYLLDANGNRTQTITNGSYSAIDTFNSADQLIKRGGANFGGYDANGNATSDGTGQAYVYSPTNQTTQTTPPGGATISAAYADSDQNERLTFGGTTSTIGRFGVDQDTTGGATSYYTRDSQGGLVSERLPGGTFYYLFDLRGSVVGLADGTGAVVNRYAYDATGNLTSPASAAPVANPWRFDSEYQDAATGLYHMGARYFDPRLGRFTQTDPSGRELNSFLFGGGDPVNNIDPSGLSYAAAALGGAAGGAIGAAIGSAVPIPGVGSFAGSLIGGCVGGIAGNAIDGGSLLTGCAEGALSGGVSKIAGGATKGLIAIGRFLS